MKRNGLTKISIYNQRGQLVKNMFSGTKNAGSYTLQWDGTDNLGKKQPSGIYLIRMEMHGEKSIKKLILSKYYQSFLP